jgi:hypothetical protein
MHPIQKRMWFRLLQAALTYVAPFVAWAYLWYDGFKTF